MTKRSDLRWRVGLRQPDLAVDDVFESKLGNRQRDARLQQRAVAELALGERVAHRGLDLALRGHPDDFEEFADIHVEAVFVHGALLPLVPVRVYRGRLGVEIAKLRSIPRRSG